MLGICGNRLFCSSSGGLFSDTAEVIHTAVKLLTGKMVFLSVKALHLLGHGHRLAVRSSRHFSSYLVKQLHKHQGGALVFV